MAKKAAPRSSSEVAWIEAGNGYAVAQDGERLVARNAKGQVLASVPAAVKQSDAAEQLVGLKEWLGGHAQACLGTVEGWMLRSLPVPSAVLAAVWDDPAWRAPLENAVVTGGDDAGFLKGVDPERGIGVVDLDGETVWLEATRVALPHPILLAELEDWRALAGELGLQQGVPQLFRETHAPTAAHATAGTSIDDFAGGRFAQLNHALGKCRALGYRVRGGFSVTRVWERGAQVEARFWVGSDAPEAETSTGPLSWVDERERPLKVAEVGPVAFSEGMRMASAIYAARDVEKTEAQ